MATSKLQIEVGDLLDRTFPEYRIRENYRPDWLMSSNLTKLELDFYIEELKIAFEVQGKQHYEFTPFFFNTIADFEKRKQYDSEKRDLCYGAGIKLIEVDSLLDAELEIDKIKISTEKPPEGWKFIQTPEHIQKRRERIEEKQKAHLVMKEIKNNLKTIMSENLEKSKRDAVQKRKELLRKNYAQSKTRKYISALRGCVPDNEIPKNKEVRQFARKLEYYYKSGDQDKGKFFSFEFTYLNQDEREILLDGLRAVHIRYE